MRFGLASLLLLSSLLLFFSSSLPHSLPHSSLTPSLVRHCTTPLARSDDDAQREETSALTRTTTREERRGERRAVQCNETMDGSRCDRRQSKGRKGRGRGRGGNSAAAKGRGSDTVVRTHCAHSLILSLIICSRSAPQRPDVFLTDRSRQRGGSTRLLLHRSADGARSLLLCV